MSNPTSPQPPNAFSASFLEALSSLDEPLYAGEAEAEGPWTILCEKNQFKILRSWEREELGHEPEAKVNRAEVALLLTAALPALGRERLFEAHDGESGQQVLLMEGLEVGELRVFNSDLLTGAHFLACVARSPLALAALAEAAGPLTMEKVGQILHGRMTAAERTRLASA
jgi:hypothetical protein